MKVFTVLSSSSEDLSSNELMASVSPWLATSLALHFSESVLYFDKCLLLTYFAAAQFFSKFLNCFSLLSCFRFAAFGFSLPNFFKKYLVSGLIAGN